MTSRVNSNTNISLKVIVNKLNGSDIYPKQMSSGRVHGIREG